MIKATIKETKREIFARSGAKKIATGMSRTGKNVNGIILDHYKVIATGKCLDKQIHAELNNVLMFKKQKEVA